ncbi:uncharacterized protein LOC132735508, partial [Ruditapes philippinarum]|uniref:uncharacterized protein LOC132735508 n=1 Tax=Ruditapes philippinarum TaxID=129788 RepID=UPI00295B31FB
QCTKFIYDVTRLRALKSSGCTKFCQCEHASTETDGSVTYKWAEHTCAPGLLFDEEIKVCNWPDNVQCNANNNGDNGGVVVGGGNSDNGGIVGGGDGVNGGDDGAQGSADNDAGSCESEQGKCTRDIYENIRLRALKSSGCTKFCQCEHASTETDGSVTYKWAEHSCAPGLLFDEKIKVCNWPQQVQCQANVPEDCEKELGQCTKFIYDVTRLRALKSSGCTKFCQCEHASTETDGSVTYKWAEHTCAPGLLFDEEIKVCNWPGNVQCNGIFLFCIDFCLTMGMEFQNLIV